MRRSTVTAIDAISNPDAAKSKARAFLRARPFQAFARDENGAMIIFGIFMFGLMLAIGGLSFDLMRYEAHRERLQSTLDRAVLAAASLSQTLDPTEVVEQYFAKAGMTDYLDSVIVTESVNSRRVDATATINVPLHHGNFAIFGGTTGAQDTLVAEAHSIAQESIGDVEISMVLDVSGSMNSYNRLENLKIAAKGFLDTVYDSSEPDAVSTSIIPYATQVNAGATLLSNYNRLDSHEFSHCINFTNSDFNTTALSTTDPLQQTSAFDAWSNENNFNLGDEPPNPVCAPMGHTDAGDRAIIPWSTNKDTLKTFVESLKADGNTSTDVGVKWGAALLDPGSQGVLSNLVATGDVSAAIDGRPYAFNSGAAMKILVVMTDGAHTSQYYMDDYRSGDSFVWKHVSSGVARYSIWYDGEGSTPITNPSGSYTYCDDWNQGSCNNWTNGTDPEFWYVISDDGSAGEWRSTPYGGSSSSRMDWSQVWAEIPPEYFSDEMLYSMSSLNSTERNAFEYAMSSYGTTLKNSRFDNICAAAKDQDVIIFAVGLEVTYSNANRLRNCASSAAHYYNVDNLDIGQAFQSIASQINQLRLIQ